jgi:hypothetical protein
MVAWFARAVATADDDKNAEFAVLRRCSVCWPPYSFSSSHEDDTKIFSRSILALFGEQFALQFMSESLIWLDHLIFAMVPLGIIAAITGAIRVQGPNIAKAFIGRVRENTAQVEFELMSSTSHEVGEAFNGKGIVRVLGKPTVATFLVFDKEYNKVKEHYEKESRGEKDLYMDPDRLKACGIHCLETVVYSKSTWMSHQC